MSILDKINCWLDRREVVLLRKELKALQDKEKALAPGIAYLKGRDELCSSLANTVNKQAFEIAKLKGVYDASGAGRKVGEKD